MWIIFQYLPRPLDCPDRPTPSPTLLSRICSVLIFVYDTFSFVTYRKTFHDEGHSNEKSPILQEPWQPFFCKRNHFAKILSLYFFFVKWKNFWISLGIQWEHNNIWWPCSTPIHMYVDNKITFILLCIQNDEQELMIIMTLKFIFKGLII